jgi:hypothetical protein
MAVTQSALNATWPRLNNSWLRGVAAGNRLSAMALKYHLVSAMAYGKMAGQLGVIRLAWRLSSA